MLTKLLHKNADTHVGQRHSFLRIKSPVDYGREVPVRVVKFPFVREGKAQPGI